MIVETLVSCLLLIGGAFALLGSIGLARFPDLLTRLHGPSKATTLGIGSLLLAAIAFFSVRGEGVSVHELAITVFVTISTPVSAQLVAKAALRRREAPAGRAGPGGTT
jgi:multicomponent K+:H+ antiporter subunit G